MILATIFYLRFLQLFDLEALPKFWQAVAERINQMNMAADEGGFHLLSMFAKVRQLKQETESLNSKNEAGYFFSDLRSSLKDIMTSLPQEIERAQNFLNGSDGQLAVKISLTQAQAKLENFVKSASEKYSLPEDIVKASLIENLNSLADKGNNAALSIVDGFGGASNALDTFLANAQEAITYLQASPDKFLPALNSMMNGIQRIDPLTGKVTEQFKKAHEALKQWGNVTFDQLSNRIQRLRKAVEGGFIDKSALEAEFKRVMPQLKLQVVNDLEPLRSQYRTESDYQAVIASALISKINDLFGDFGTQLAANIFNGKTGSEMGHSIIAEVERGISNISSTFNLNGIDQFNQGLGSIQNLPQNISNAISPYVLKLEQFNNAAAAFGQRGSGAALDLVKNSNQLGNFSGTFNINGIEQLQQGLNSIATLPLNISNAVSPYVSKLEQISNSQIASSNNANPYSAIKDYSSEIAAVVREIQASSQANVSAVDKVTSAVNSVEAIIKSQQNDSFSQSVINAFSPFIAQFEQNTKVFQASSTSITQKMQELSSNFDALKKSADNSISAMTSLQSSVNSAAESYEATNITNAVNPLSGAVLNLANTLNDIQHIQQENASALSEVINAVKTVESALKNFNAGNNYDIDIIQQGFNVHNKSDADYAARSAVSALRSGLGNGGV